MSGYTKSVSVSIWTGFDDQAIYGDWLAPENQARSSLFVNTMKYFNKDKDTSQFDFSDARVELTKKENIKVLQINDENKITSLLDSNLKLPTIIKNKVQATPEQKQFKTDFDNNKLTNDYANIKPYFDSNNALGFGLYKSKKSDSTKFYRIDESGKLSNE